MHSSECNEFYLKDEFVLDVWGKFACFTRPTSKVERVTYDVMTPSAARGVVEAIYWKPEGFYYQITKIEVMKPIRYINIPRTELKAKLNDKGEIEPLYTKSGSEENTIRHTLYLRDVYYRIYGKIVCSDKDMKHKFYAHLERRIRKGQCHHQPSLGTRECMAYFSYPKEEMKPLDLSAHLGEMLYDVFDFSSVSDVTKGEKVEILNTTKKSNNVKKLVKPRGFIAQLVNGAMYVPNCTQVYHMDKVGDNYV